MEISEKLKDVLIIGAGIAGMEAAQQIALSKRKVYLIEKESYIGGNGIKSEEVFPNMECSTCLLAPMQQELLQNENVTVMTLSELVDIKGSGGNFSVKIRKKARYVDEDACIGCNMCFEPCPVSLSNVFEENLSQKKAISTPCSGALPNIPSIDADHCLRFLDDGEDCQLCKDACMFEALDYEQEDRDITLEVGSIIVATGFTNFDEDLLKKYGHDGNNDVYYSFEFERLFATNGPTEGKIILKDGSSPSSAAIIHCVGREEKGYCSGICCLSSMKFTHYLKKRLPDIKIIELYQEMCVPGKVEQKYYREVRDSGVEMARYDMFSICDNDGTPRVDWTDEDGVKNGLSVDMVILSLPLMPEKNANELSKVLDVQLDEHGFFQGNDPLIATTILADGIFAAGCCLGPRDMKGCVSQSDAAVGEVLSYLEGGK